MSDKEKGNTAGVNLDNKDRMEERVRKAGEMEKRLHKDGYEMDVPFMTEMANKHIIHSKVERDKFIAIIEKMAISPDSLTEEEFTFYYHGHELIDCAETAEGERNQEENDDDE